MYEQQKVALHADAWKELISRLPGVLNAELIFDGDAVREIHILADQSRTAKQIVRDVQSALAARFQVELDHRIISVAQVSDSSSSSPTKKRLICQQLDLSTGRSGITVAVTLELDGQKKKGESLSSAAPHERDRCIAQAAVESINAFLNGSCRFFFTDCKHIPFDDHDALLVGLQLFIDGKSEPLLGACLIGDDPNLSVVLATLDAVNRRILTLPLCSSD